MALKWKGLKVAANFYPEVQGFEELFKKMDDLAQEIGTGKTDKIWRGALLNAMQPVLDDAKSFAPGDSPSATGQLRDSIYMKAHKPTARDKRSESYMGEMYLVRVTASPKRKESYYRVMRNKKGNYQTVLAGMRPVALSQEFGNERLANSEFGTAAKGAHPFLRPALESNRDSVMNRLAQVLWYELFLGKYAKRG
jgi:HK97 gp10 family phage protein